MQYKVLQCLVSFFWIDIVQVKEVK